jgi:hypothetical protein
MDGYSFNELAGVHRMFGCANGSSQEARLLYQEAFPHQQLPNHQIFTATDCQLRETGM